MQTRRKFLIQGSLATTAVLALKPFNAIANFTGIGNSHAKLVFLHTANFDPGHSQQFIQYITTVKNSQANAILLKAGQDSSEDQTSRPAYDVSMNETDYTIINKAGIRTGIISAKPGSNVIERINTLSAWLKKEKNCSVVVCLSLLGYRNKYAADDVTLAKKSTHLDVIIGGHTENFPKYPMIALNSNQAEVVIHSAAGDPADLGTIELSFNERGLKQNISFSNRSNKAVTAA